MMIKYFVAAFCLAQAVLSAPATEPSIVEQAQQTIAKVQQQANAAVTDFNAKVLQATNANSNVDLLSRVQTQSETYANQLKGVAEQISAQAAQNKAQTDNILNNIAKQFSDTAAGLLGNQDPAKVNTLQQSFGNVLANTNSLQVELAKQGEVAQAAFANLLSNLYTQTTAAAQNVATQLDEAQKH